MKKKLSSRLLSYYTSESLREMLLSQHYLLALQAFTCHIHHTISVSLTVTSVEKHKWRCCCATDCCTSDVRISLFHDNTVSDVSKFLYFRPIWNFMNVCDRPTTAVLKPQSVSSPHTFSVLRNASSRPNSSTSSSMPHSYPRFKHLLQYLIILVQVLPILPLNTIRNRLDAKVINKISKFISYII